MARDPRFPDEVDFVLGPDDVDSVDEELPQRPHRRRPTRRVVLLMVAPALIGALAAAIAVGRSGGSPSAAASVSVSVSPSVPASSSPSDATAGPSSVSSTAGPQIAIRHERTTVILVPQAATSLPVHVAPTSGPAPACRAARLCLTSTVVNPGVVRALRARFGVVTVDSVKSVLTGASVNGLRLNTRIVLAHAGGQSIAIVVAPLQAADRSQVTFGKAGSGVSVTVTDAARPWTVTVTVRTPRTLDADTVTPAKLAADPRLHRT